ncbi:hypothetical protein BDL97_07G057200 [Sphagnum fallax]|jgi:hypothetical protein|nr:hypothetical protein BDL97_07G057200 [Sphagnum fallax]
MDSDALLLPAGLVAFDNSLKKQQQQQKPLTVAAADAAGSSFADIFQIDDLLDFSNEDIAGPIGEAVHVLKPETIGGCLTPFLENGTELQHLAPKAHKLEGEEEEAAIEADLCLPQYDDLEELEWASRFLEDSFPVTGDDESHKTWSDDNGSAISIGEKETELSALFMKKQHQYYEKAAASPVSVLEHQASATSSELTGSDHSLDFCVPGRARSKRSRSEGKKWTSGILSSTTTSCGTNRVSASPSQWSAGEEEDTVEEGEEWQSCNFQKAKQSRKSSSQQDGEVLRCTHCQTQRTPQWRTGPMGPKTLCNACGVRYKSGRLLPEYRPASSPAYIPHKHSNSHKKILEMRQQREMMEASM